jgi:asparagine synthase (glutamine-hydrolysing)
VCGIAGFVECTGAPRPLAERESIAAAMARLLIHRGPDEASALHWKSVSVGFRRLSINDPSHGSQPFHSPDGSISAFVNGELYNHRELRAGLKSRDRLETHSDCEVLPFLYEEHGLRAFEHINGMFAAVVLDRANRALILARDRMGIKPLFYAPGATPGRWIFGSEIKALLAHPEVETRFDWRQALQQGSWPLADLEELPSGFIGIERVPPGGMIRIDLETGRIESHRYWQLDRAATALPPPQRSEVPERFRALLGDSVQARLMADAGVGLFLSGGIDSVAIAALAAQHQSIPTFSVWNAATIASGDAAASRAAAAAFGLPNHAVRISTEDAPSPDDWRNLLWACEIPTITAEQWFKYRLHAFARHSDAGLKVILLGQGSDEFLGGYLHWMTGIRRAETQEAWRQIERSLTASRRMNTIDAAGIAPAFRAWFESGWLDARHLAPTQANSWIAYRQRYRINLDYHLWHEDRTAAAHGIENRVPFLDHRLLEFLASIPESQHGRWFGDKHLLRESMRGRVPPSLIERPKGYFFYGNAQVEVYRMIAGMLRADSGALLEQAVVGSAATDGPLTPGGIRAMAAEVFGDPALRGLTSLLYLVNMGVLSDLARHRDALPETHAGVPPESLDEPTLQSMLAAASPKFQGIDPTDVHALASGISLLEMRRPAAGESASGCLYLIEASRVILTVQEPAMSAYLCQLDGIRSLEAIATEHALSLEVLQQAIAEALELGLLARVDIALRARPGDSSQG